MANAAAPTAPAAAPERIAVEGFENLYQMAASQFARAAETMGLDPNLRTILPSPRTRSS